MKFRTEYTARKAAITLSPELPVVMAGSCFTQNMASKMKEYMWEAVNPAGTLYNPRSISIAINMMIDRESGIESFEKSLFEFNGLWNSRMFDSSFSSVRKDDCLEEFKQSQKLFAETLSKGKILIVTFGTSICYFLNETECPVGNCHKQPSEEFYRRRLGIEEISEVWQETIKALQSKFPGIKIIFTVSPVRHLKDGFTGNSRSKAILQLAIEKICEENPECYYFPAYEILNDDLRDYRFYASDLVHPSEEAVDYIWEKFKETFTDESGRKMLEEGARLYKTLNHRPKTGALGKPLKFEV